MPPPGKKEIARHVADQKPLSGVSDIDNIMAEDTREPIVRMTLRIPESLINEFESITTHEDARSMNVAVCNSIRETIARHHKCEGDE